MGCIGFPSSPTANGFYRCVIQGFLLQETETDMANWAEKGIY